MHQKQLIHYHNHFKKGLLELFCDQMITNGNKCATMKVIVLPRVCSSGGRAQTSLSHVSFRMNDVSTANLTHQREYDQEPGFGSQIRH